MGYDSILYNATTAVTKNILLDFDRRIPVKFLIDILFELIK